METNRGLKYFCHGCRKQQQSYNDVVEKCNNIMKKMNENVVTWKEDLDRQMRMLEQNICNKMEFEIESVAKEISKAIEENKVSAKKLESVVKQNSHSVKNATVPASESGLDAGVGSGPSSNLRSRKGSQSLVKMCNNDSNGNNITPSANGKQQRTKTYASQVKRKEPIVIVRPKVISQTASKTKQYLRENIDRSANRIQTVREGKEGSVILEVKDVDAVDAVIASVKNNCGNNYEVSVPRPIKPRLKISGVGEQFCEEELIQLLSDQNDDLEVAHLKIVTCYKQGQSEYSTFNFIVEVDQETHESMIDAGWVNIDWDRCRVVESYGIIRCYKCCNFGHKSINCENYQVCSKCAGDHSVKECSSQLVRCVNCERVNKSRKLGLKTDHYAYSNDCAVYKRLVAKKRQRIDQAE